MKAKIINVTEFDKIFVGDYLVFDCFLAGDFLNCLIEEVERRGETLLHGHRFFETKSKKYYEHENKTYRKIVLLR